MLKNKKALVLWLASGLIGLVVSYLDDKREDERLKELVDSKVEEILKDNAKKIEWRKF